MAVRYTVYILLTLLIILTLLSIREEQVSKYPSPEYTLVVLSPDSVLIRSVGGREYRAHIDSIQAIIEIDNI